MLSPPTLQTGPPATSCGTKHLEFWFLGFIFVLFDRPVLYRQQSATSDKSRPNLKSMGTDLHAVLTRSKSVDLDKTWRERRQSSCQGSVHHRVVCRQVCRRLQASWPTWPTWPLLWLSGMWQCVGQLDQEVQQRTTTPRTINGRPPINVHLRLSKSWPRKRARFLAGSFARIGRNEVGQVRHLTLAFCSINSCQVRHLTYGLLRGKGCQERFVPPLLHSGTS